MIDLPEGSSVEATDAVAQDVAAAVLELPEVLSVQTHAERCSPVQFQRPCAALLSCARGPRWAMSRSIWITSITANAQAMKSRWKSESELHGSTCPKVQA